MSSILDTLGRYGKDFISPFKRYPEIYKEHVDQSLGLLGVGEGETGVGSKALGALGYGFSPISAAYQAFRDEPLRDVMIGKGVDPEKAEKIAYMAGLGMDIATPLAATKLGVTAQQAINRAYSPNVGNLALTQDITRRTKAHQTDRFLKDWYAGGKAQHLAKGVLRGATDYAEMFASPQKAYLFKKYGLSPGNVRDLKRMFDLQKKMEKSKVGESVKKVDRFGRKTDVPIQPRVLRNEIHSNLAYIDSVFRKFMPDDVRRKAFEEELFEHLFPRQVFTNPDHLRVSSEPFRKILDIPKEISDDAIKTHLNPYVLGEWNLQGPIALNSKPYQSRPSADLMRGGYSHPLHQFKDIWERMSSPMSKENMLEFARNSNAKKLGNSTKEEYYQKILKRFQNSRFAEGPSTGKLRFTGRQAEKEAKKELNSKLYNIEHLKNNIIDEGGYVSMGGSILSQDRLLAHIYNRIIIKKPSTKRVGRKHQRGMGTPEGVWVSVDQMKQGSGVPLLEKAMDLGSEYNFLAADVFPISKQFGMKGRTDRRMAMKIETQKGTGRFGTQSAETQTPVPKGGLERDVAIRTPVERMMGERVPSAFVRQRLGQQAKQVGKGAIGAGILGTAFGEDVRRRKRIGAY
jgi:hypothetical protein